MDEGNGIHLTVPHLSRLSATLAEAGRPLEIHLIGHSAGAILLGHLIEHMAGTGWPAASPLTSCTLLAPACSARFANARYVRQASQVLPLNKLWLSYLTDANEKLDALPSPAAPAYGKSLLYIVSRALDDARKMPILGLERCHDSKFAADADQWAPDQVAEVKAWQQVWIKSGGPTRRTTIVSDATVRNTKVDGRVQATHGSFDNNIEILTATLQRIRGRALVADMEWLDY
jgi:hypothetical protein